MIALFAGPARSNDKNSTNNQADNSKNNFKLDNWINFVLDKIVSLIFLSHLQQ